MTSFIISDRELDHIKGQVVIITGASSGIGLATLRRIIKHGGKVFASDLNPLPEPEASSVPFRKANVTSWKDQVELFKAAEKEFGTIDHVFANAGIQPVTSLMEEDVDENGDLLPPKLDTLNVNLTGCIYTVKLGIFYLKKNPKGGSIVVTASASSFSRLPATDYTAAKHGVLGLVRALYGRLYPKLPIRINAIAPSWTDTGIVPRDFLAQLGEGNYQSADVVGRSVTVLMADPQRHGEMIYSDKGKYTDLENGENGYHALTLKMLNVEQDGDFLEMGAFKGLMKEKEEAVKVG
ncbi:NAD(P)-binding protein [Cucurbitaria berberidis CBS 394.84]|uniref:NAD(P)-binding protein n=1 Tax=Cucurbitaria berberidis CBS 394.84 TaxID=1168544 RepID=A0A9P4LDM3_9PLEO|nr:NAD(P)-binding protein [Cucurbitaria berberidis CBS 394.84]KAF1850537.1 NAD(P)-binding protein [Cucurbitaria berberidis CBS 394.84]